MLLDILPPLQHQVVAAEDSLIIRGNLSLFIVLSLVCGISFCTRWSSLTTRIMRTLII